MRIPRSARTLLAILMLLVGLALPSWGQANSGPHPVDGGRMDLDGSKAGPNPTPMGRANPWEWGLCVTGMVLLGGSIVWAARRGNK